jgi:adenylate cyclase
MFSRFDKSFSDVYKAVYENSKQQIGMFSAEMAEVRKSLSEGLGHPNFTDMEYGEIIPGSIIVFFMDIRGFTKISIALDNEELIRILQATTIASIYSVRKFGGYIIEYTGDGIMAYFGDGIKTTSRDAFNSLRTAAYLMEGIKNNVNSYLSRNGDETIRIGIGLEYGNTLWTRIGTPDASIPKPISEVTFIAGKNSSHAKSWEVIIGKNIAEWVPEGFKNTYEPYEFQKDNLKYSYDRFLFKWQEFSKQFNANQQQTEHTFLKKNLPQLGTTIISNTGTVINTSNTTTKGPRPLKDQPFF